MKKIKNVLLGIAICSSLASCGDSNRIVIYCATEEEKISFLQEKLNSKFPNYNIVFQNLGTGAMVSKLQGEGRETDCDIFFDLEVNNSELLLENNNDLFYDLSDYDFSIYDDSVLGYSSRHKKYAIHIKTNGALVINKSVLKKHNIPVPTTYQELTDAKYKGLVSMANPKSSGTGYCFYSGLTSLWGKETAYKYFTDLSKNVIEFTNSGSGPTKAVDRGEAAVGFAILWQAVGYVKNNPDLDVVILDNASPFNLYSMGIINGKEIKKGVKEVFDYFYNELNEELVSAITLDVIYKNQITDGIDGYPTGFGEIDMNLYDVDYKQELLDSWRL